MQPYSLNICNKVVRVEERLGSYIDFCNGYIIKEPAPKEDYSIVVTKDDIDIQRIISGPWTNDDLSGLVILRKLAKVLLEKERTLLFHGAVVAYHDSAFMFTAPSGTGKTTHSKLWVQKLPDAYIVNGDKPFVSTDNGIYAWGTPWSGAEHYNRNEGVELKAICFMERADNNRIVEISDDEAIPMLALQTADPDPSDYHTKIWMMEGINRLRRAVKFYRYEVNNYIDNAFYTTYDRLSKL